MLLQQTHKALDSVTSSPSNCVKALGVAAIVSSPYRHCTLPRALKLFPERAPPGMFTHTQSPIKMKALLASAHLPALCLQTRTMCSKGTGFAFKLGKQHCCWKKEKGKKPWLLFQWWLFPGKPGL